MNFEEQFEKDFKELYEMRGQTYPITHEGFQKIQRDMRRDVVKFCLSKAKVREAILNMNFEGDGELISPRKLLRELGLNEDELEFGSWTIIDGKKGPHGLKDFKEGEE